MKNYLLLSLFLLFLIGCKEEETSTEENIYLKTYPTEENRGFIDDPYSSLAWQGKYSGVLPCGDCRGVDTTLELNRDSTFVLNQRELVDAGIGEVYETTGKFQWNNDKTIISLTGRDSLLQFKVGHLFLMPLNSEGEELEEVKGNNFRLLKE